MAEDYEAIIGEIGVFQRLPSSARRILAARARTRTLDDGHILFREGDPVDGLYVILDGQVQIRITGEDGRPMSVAHRRRGETVGEMAILDGKPRSADAVVAEPSRLLFLDRSAFVECVSSHPDVAMALISCLAERLRQATQDLGRRNTADVPARTAAALLELSESRHCGQHPEGVLLPAINQTELAFRIGARRESVSRCISTYKRMGLLRAMGRRILVTDLERLRQRAAG